MTEPNLPVDSSKMLTPAAWVAAIACVATVLLLAALHFLNPEFDPSFRMVSEYALGHYTWVLSLMFLSWGISSWALVVAIRPQIRTTAGKVGLAFLVIAGVGEAMASWFDVRHEIGHGIAGILGVFGFPVAAVLLTMALRRTAGWQRAGKALLWIANLSWICVVLLFGSLVLMTTQMIRANGGHLPQHAPKSLPPGVLGIDGWADRLLIVTFCTWVFVVAVEAVRLRSTAR